MRPCTGTVGFDNCAIYKNQTVFATRCQSVKYIAPNTALGSTIVSIIGGLVGTISPGQVSPRRAQQIVKAIANRAEISKPVSPHVLRHTFATICVQKGISIAALMKLMGHDKLETTAIYQNMAGEDVVTEFNEKW